MEAGHVNVNAVEVHGALSRHMLADGFDLVVDLDKSQGCRFYDAKRHEYYLDLFSFFGTCPLGFNHPYLTSSAAREALLRASIHKPSNSDVYSREMAAFVQTFSRIAKPDFLKYMFFIEGGALAVENALKVAFDWKVRKNLAKGSGEKGFQVLHLREAFHGRSGYALSLTNTSDPRKTQYFPKFDWPRVVNPKCRFPLEGRHLQQVKALEERAVKQIQAAIARDVDDIACLILEPIQGEGGDNHFRPEFHQTLRSICDQHDILLIHDEVQTGLGATGKMWAHEYFVHPDILAFGKKTQVCGILVSERVDSVADNVFHVSNRLNSTWGGSLVDMVRCRLYLEAYRDEDVLVRSCVQGGLLLRELQQLQREFPELISNARGRGLFCAFDLPDPELRDRLRQTLFEKRLLILACGDRSLRFRPALNIAREDLYEGLDILRTALQALVPVHSA